MVYHIVFCVMTAYVAERNTRVYVLENKNRGKILTERFLKFLIIYLPNE